MALGRKSGWRRSGSVRAKHLLALWDYSTPRKLLNLQLCELEKRLRVVRPRSLPYSATIDVTNACNLRCPGCPTGLGIVGRKKTLLAANHLESFLEELGPYLFIAHLYNWGETLLHPQAAEIVRKVHEARVFTSISSNMIVSAQALEAVCEAGLDHLMVSADGATRETYPVYRVGGDFDQMLDNIRAVVAHRKRRGSTRPILEWQMLAFRHLEHELEQARALAAELEVDWFSVGAPIAPSRLALPDRADPNRDSPLCALLWHGVTLQADGGLSPCCYLYDQQDDFGHVQDATIRATRHGERYVFARELFDRRWAAALDSGRDHPCLRCPIVHKQDHLRAYLERNPHARVDPDFMGIVRSRADVEKAWQGM